MVVAALLGGCSLPSTSNPVQWWHEMEGGAIAQQRPPPPGIDAPYPNLGSVPPKPDMPDPAARQRLSGTLLADRANAQYEATLAPLVNTRRPASPRTPAAADPNAASASMPAASAPAPPAAAALPAPAAPVGPPPTIPDAPPPPPRLSGLDIPLTRPTPPPVAPPAPARPGPLSASAAAPVAVGFRPGSAVLSPGGEAALESLAGRQGDHPVEVIGFGDATDPTPEVQAQGVALGLARARAIVAALTAVGVPIGKIRMNAQAGGRGGAARLLN